MTLWDPGLAEIYLIVPVLNSFLMTQSGYETVSVRLYELGPGGVPGVGDDVPLLLTQCRAGHQAGGGGASLQPIECVEYRNGIRIRIQTLISDEQK